MRRLKVKEQVWDENGKEKPVCWVHPFYGEGWLSTIQVNRGFCTLSETWWYSDKERAAKDQAEDVAYFQERYTDGKVEATLTETSGRQLSTWKADRLIEHALELREKAKDILKDLMSEARKGNCVEPDYVRAQAVAVLFGESSFKPAIRSRLRASTLEGDFNQAMTDYHNRMQKP